MRKRKSVVELWNLAVHAVMINDEQGTQLHCLTSTDISTDYSLQI